MTERAPEKPLEQPADSAAVLTAYHARLVLDGEKGSAISDFWSIANALKSSPAGKPN